MHCNKLYCSCIMNMYILPPIMRNPATKTKTKTEPKTKTKTKIKTVSFLLVLQTTCFFIPPRELLATRIDASTTMATAADVEYRRSRIGRVTAEILRLTLTSKLGLGLELDWTAHHVVPMTLRVRFRSRIAYDRMTTLGRARM